MYDVIECVGWGGMWIRGDFGHEVDGMDGISGGEQESSTCIVYE